MEVYRAAVVTSVARGNHGVLRVGLVFEIVKRNSKSFIRSFLLSLHLVCS